MTLIPLQLCKSARAYPGASRHPDHHLFLWLATNLSGVRLARDLASVACGVAMREVLVRRKFKDELPAQPKKNGKSSHALSTIQKLYAIEQQPRALSPQARCQLRQEKAAPLLMAFEVWLVESQAQLTPKSYVGEAVNYVLNQWDALNPYLENGDLGCQSASKNDLGIDNNVTERDISMRSPALIDSRQQNVTIVS